MISTYICNYYIYTYIYMYALDFKSLQHTATHCNTLQHTADFKSRAPENDVVLTGRIPSDWLDVDFSWVPHKPYIFAKEPYIPAKKPYISAREPYFRTKVLAGHNPLGWLDDAFSWVPHKTLYLHKSFLHLRQRALFSRQRASFFQHKSAFGTELVGAKPRRWFLVSSFKNRSSLHRKPSDRHQTTMFP